MKLIKLESWLEEKSKESLSQPIKRCIQEAKLTWFMMNEGKSFILHHYPDVTFRPKKDGDSTFLKRVGIPI